MSIALAPMYGIVAQTPKNSLLCMYFRVDVCRTLPKRNNNDLFVLSFYKSLPIEIQLIKGTVNTDFIFGDNMGVNHGRF